MIRLLSLFLLALSITSCAINQKPIKTDVNGTKQTFPMIINSNWKVTSSNLNKDTLKIIIENKNGDVYSSELDSESIEEAVCDKSSIYDCSTEDKIVESMIKKLAKDTIETIEGGN